MTAGPVAQDPPPKNRISSRKLLSSKWTAVAPTRREKHFAVVRLIEPDPPQLRIVQVELEAVYSGRRFVVDWRELKDATRWRQGWV
jgi:tryptophan-rich hypothetical protein